MRSLLTLFTILLFTLQTRAQEKITEGKLFYDISYLNLSESVRRNEHLLPHDAAFYFKGGKTRLEMGVGQLGKNTTLHDDSTHTTTVLLNIMGKKFALVKHDSEIAEMTKQESRPTVKVVLKEDVKPIAGFNCKKAIVLLRRDTVVEENECWFTDRIPPYNTMNDSSLKEVKGFLMKYSMTQNGMTMIMTVKTVLSVPIEDYMFNIPENYQRVNEEELDKLLRVMQGSSGK